MNSTDHIEDGPREETSAEIARLHAEIDRQRQIIAELTPAVAGAMKDQDRIAELERENAELRKDKQRLEAGAEARKRSTGI